LRRSIPFGEFFKSGLPFKELDRFVGNPSASFQEWVAHPELSAYWDNYNSFAEQLSIPAWTMQGGVRPDFLHKRVAWYVMGAEEWRHADMPESVTLVDHRRIHALRRKQLIYHGAPFERETEITGFFRLSVWLAIDQPDTDFSAVVYLIGWMAAACVWPTTTSVPGIFPWGRRA
jgi:predicted acyl esterase